MARTGFAFTGAQADADVIAAPAAGLHLEILRFHFTTSAAATIAFTDGADATATRLIYGDFGANGGVVMDSFSLGTGHLYPVAVLTGATAFKVTSSAGNLKGVVEYRVCS